MNRVIFKQLTSLIAGIFLAGMIHSFGQENISESPSGNNIELGGKTLYERGYNHEAGPNAPREARDSVMIGSMMNYFVMPDRFYNSSYFGQNDYAATNLTRSRFVWEVDAPSFATAITPQIPNTTGSSPWVKITWNNTRGDAYIKIREQPQTGLQITCDGVETTIPVTVISKPVIQFVPKGALGDEKFEIVDCIPVGEQGELLNVTVDFPITVQTESSQLMVDYELVFINLEGNRTSLPNVSDFPITVETSSSDNGIATITGTLSLTVSQYGAYEMTITKITDRIARKCDTEGIVVDASNANVFTYTVIPQPRAGRTYHVPNNF